MLCSTAFFKCEDLAKSKICVVKIPYDELMTGMTHQMVALLAALWILTLYPVSFGPILGFLAIGAVMAGALTPDLDQPTANIWRRMLGARAIGNIFEAFSGGHRHMTHSLIGIYAVGWALRWAIANLLNPAVADQAHHLWTAFMIGYVSHPIADTLTDRGVPWLWPFRWHIRIPPGPEEVRVTTGSIVEMLIIRGGLIIAFLLIMSAHWQTVLGLFKSG